MLLSDNANPQPTSTEESIAQQEVEEVSNSTIEDQFQDLMVQRVQNHVSVPMPIIPLTQTSCLPNQISD